MLARIYEDVRAALARDPAATSVITVLLTYPGLHALWGYRLANRLLATGLPRTARLVSHAVRFLTGVEIHPGATIGRRCFIDHGMGTVIGETAVVGDDVHMYHGVTLGGNDPRPTKRHPTLEDRVTVGADATLLGDIIIGEDATVGAGAVVVDDVPPGTTVVGNPAHPIDNDSETAVDLDCSEPSDPVSADGGQPTDR